MIGDENGVTFQHTPTSFCLPFPSHDSPFCPRGCRECSPKSRLPVFFATVPCMTRPCLPLSTTVPSESVRHEYIARYAYRVAITNSRILDVTDSNVSYFSSASCHSPFGNHTKTDIFPHNNQITFAAAVQRSGVSYHLAGDTKPILLYYSREFFAYFL